MTIKELLQFTSDAEASDLHISTGSVPMIRVFTKMKKLNMPVLSAEEVKKLIFEVLTEDQQKTLLEEREIDFSTKLTDETRFRVNAFTQLNGLAASFRLIPNVIKSFEELNLPNILGRLALMDKGLILLTGPTGSGKTTTLSAMIDVINERKSRHIITIEDPVEYVHESKNSLINQREVGHDTKSFAGALRSALRQDPDVILVGEMRDLETVSLALTAAETGHLVLSTLHTSGATKSIDRIIDTYPKEQQAQVKSMLSESLEAVVAQKILPMKGGHGLVPAVEIMIANSAVRNLIREGKTFQIPSILQSGAKEGMQSLDQSLYSLVTNGLIDRDVAEEVSTSPQMFQTGT